MNSRKLAEKILRGEHDPHLVEHSRQLAKGFIGQEKKLDRCRESCRRMKEVYKHARGLCYGYDWNKGTHAKAHRKKLLRAVNKIEPLPDYENKDND